MYTGLAGMQIRPPHAILKGFGSLTLRWTTWTVRAAAGYGTVTGSYGTSPITLTSSQPIGPSQGSTNVPHFTVLHIRVRSPATGRQKGVWREWKETLYATDIGGLYWSGEAA